MDKNEAQPWYFTMGTIDKRTTALDYNLITNNCADETMSALQLLYPSNDTPYLFTTPGDAMDYFKAHGNAKPLYTPEDGADGYFQYLTDALAEELYNYMRNKSNQGNFGYYMMYPDDVSSFQDVKQCTDHSLLYEALSSTENGTITKH